MAHGWVNVGAGWEVFGSKHVSELLMEELWGEGGCRTVTGGRAVVGGQNLNGRGGLVGDGQQQGWNGGRGTGMGGVAMGIVRGGGLKRLAGHVSWRDVEAGYGWPQWGYLWD
jgi:hypothetical protein